MRKYFAKWILNKAREDDSIVLIIGDVGFGLFDEFKKEFPERYFNIGLAEQSMISMSAGMALEGLKPYVYAITPFLIERPYEQIKIDIALNKANVKLIGYANYPKQGPTHRCSNDQMLEYLDIDCYYPKNRNEIEKYLDHTYKNARPSFFSLR